MPRRQFINKKTATTYALVHRPQNDPLINSADAPQMVFAERSGPSQYSEDFDDYLLSSSAQSSTSRSKKVSQRGDLEEEFGFSFKQNEGQAAEQGVFYDDTSYDYMQHMRDLGGREGGEVAWVPASAPEKERRKEKGKGKVRLEDAIASLDLGSGQASASSGTWGRGREANESEADSEHGGVSLSVTSSRQSGKSLLPEEMLPSEFVRPVTYQDQQDVPDKIAGFQPNMDPRLREVLEALEDEAYVDDDEDVFGELTGEGAEEVDENEFEDMFFDDNSGAARGRMADFLDSQAVGEEDEGWESDDTVRATDDKLPQKPTISSSDTTSALPPADPNATPAADPNDGAWLSEYSKFKSAHGSAPAVKAAGITPSESADRSALSSLATGRRKKRKGAKTSTTNYSMTSSALARTDQMSLLDERFDRLLDSYGDEYADDDLGDIPEDASVSGVSALSGVSGLSKASKASKTSMASGMSRASGISTYSRATDSEAPKLVRSDFDAVMDGFLGEQQAKGGRGRRDVGPVKNGRVKRGAGGEGLRELDEIRKGLGAARLKQGV